jgi:hypothetical protein
MVKEKMKKEQKYFPALSRPLYIVLSARFPGKRHFDG